MLKELVRKSIAETEVSKFLVFGGENLCIRYKIKLFIWNHILSSITQYFVLDL